MSDDEKRKDLVSSRSAVRPGALDLRALSGRELYHAIMGADLPERVVRALPPHSVYRALAYHGVESSLELLEIAPERHYRFFLDMQLWERDTFLEDCFWEWLSAIDQEGTLEPLEKLVRALDTRVLALICRRYVHAVMGDDPTEQPPSPGYYTPDHGYTWIGIEIADAGRHRLLARLLAYIFQTRAELFYQLLNEALAGTALAFEEDAYQERLRRLREEGIPDFESAAKVVAPLSPERFLELAERAERSEVFEVPDTLAPFVVEEGVLEPLSTLMQEIGRDPVRLAEVEAELSLIGNCAVVVYCANLSDASFSERIFGSVRGALNIGLEEGAARAGSTPIALFNKLGLQPFFRLGIGRLRELRKRARELCAERQGAFDDPQLQALIDALLADMPVLPVSPEEIAAGRVRYDAEGLEIRTRPFERLAEIREIEALLTERLRH